MKTVLLQCLVEILFQIDGIHHFHRRGFDELHVFDIQNLHLGLDVVVSLFALFDDIVQRLNGGDIIVVFRCYSSQLVGENALHL